MRSVFYFEIPKDPAYDYVCFNTITWEIFEITSGCPAYECLWNGCPFMGHVAVLSVSKRD